MKVKWRCEWEGEWVNSGCVMSQSELEESSVNSVCLCVGKLKVVTHTHTPCCGRTQQQLRGTLSVSSFWDAAACQQLPSGLNAGLLKTAQEQQLVHHWSLIDPLLHFEVQTMLHTGNDSSGSGCVTNADNWVLLNVSWILRLLSSDSDPSGGK